MREKPSKENKVVLKIMEIIVHLYANKLENLGEIENFLREKKFFYKNSDHRKDRKSEQT